MWTTQEPIESFKSGIKYIHRTERNLKINFSANLLASSNECKEFAMRVALQSCCVKTWTYGYVPQSWGGTEKCLGIGPEVPACFSTPRTSCTHQGHPSHMPLVPGVEDGDLGSSLYTDELKEEIH